MKPKSSLYKNLTILSLVVPSIPIIFAKDPNSLQHCFKIKLNKAPDNRMALRAACKLRDRFMQISLNAAKAPELGPSSIPTLRFIQFMRKNDTRKRLGLVSDDGTMLSELSGNACVSNEMVQFLKQKVSMQEIQNKLETLAREPITDEHKLLPPIGNPGKIICMGLNYADHCKEQNKPVPEEPMFFSKFTTALVGPRCNVVLPKVSEKVDWEVELAVVIGKTVRFVDRKEAMDAVFGYSIAQDISARDWQRRNGGQYLLGKSMDTFCPLGPSVVHKSLVGNVNGLNMKTRINGVEKQNGTTGDMIFKIDDVISRLSQFMTLYPGDIILTGTPSGVGVYRNPREYLKAGDVIESEIEGLGKMINKVVAE